MNLGARIGTKVKRSQAVVVCEVAHRPALFLLRALVHHTHPHREICAGRSLPELQATSALSIPDFTFHSARAGFLPTPTSPENHSLNYARRAGGRQRRAYIAIWTELPARRWPQPQQCGSGKQHVNTSDPTFPLVLAWWPEIPGAASRPPPDLESLIPTRNPPLKKANDRACPVSAVCCE